MINNQYKLTSPLLIERQCESIDLNKKGYVIVKPTYLSICKADMRYYFGQRNAEVLKQRLPMVLIHEACGEVIFDPENRFPKHTKVVLLPNIGGKDTFYLENYRLDSVFRSSKADGFMQEMISMDHEHIVPYSKQGFDSVFSFTEFISVGVHAVNSFLASSHSRRDNICVFGDGALAYVVCSILKNKLKNCKVTVMGINPVKLQYFNFVDEVINISRRRSFRSYDHAFECVGGNASGTAINQIIDIIAPQGTIMLLGVSEENVALNTRMILEKGLTLMGRSRSCREDFVEAVSLIENDRVFASRMKQMISEQVEVNSVNDIVRGFDLAKTSDFKVVLHWCV